MAERVFVARESELAQLQSFLDRALAGQGAVCFVTGEAGAGKTALITELARRAQDAHPSLLVSAGLCNAHAGIGDPYLPFREVLRQLTGDVATEAVSEENAGRLAGFLRVSGRAIAELGPDLIDIFVPGGGLITRAAAMAAGRAGWLDRLEQLTGRKSTSNGDLGLEQSHIFEQYANVLQAMAAQQPLMLVLDDLQWADADSISLLFHLCRRIAESPVLIVGTYRPADVALGRGGDRHPLEQVVHELTRYHGDIFVALGQAEESEGRQFVDAFLDTGPNRLGEPFRQALFRHTGGHPLFTIELLRDMQERRVLVEDEEGYWVEAATLDWGKLPPRVEGVIGERIGRLEAELRETLTIASVEGEDFLAEVIAQVQAVDERGLVRRLSQELDRQHRLVGAVGTERLLRQRLSRYRFRHSLFQKYLYDGLDEVERSFLHEDVGTVLEALYADQADEVAVQLARHFEEAGLDDKARHYLFQAGVQARRHFANADALAYLSRALALAAETDAPGRYAILRERERVYDMQGVRDDQQHDLAALEELAEALGDERHRAEVALRRAKYAEVTGDFPAAIAAAQRAGTLAQAAGAPETEAAGYLHWGRALWRQADFPAATAQLEQALSRFREIGDGQGEGRTLNSLGNVSADLSDYAAAMVRYEQALDICRQSGDRLGEGMVLNNLAVISQEQGDFARARDYCEQALEASREIGDREGEGYVLINLGLVADYQGDYDAATAYCERALRIRHEISDRRGEGNALSNMGLFLHHRGDDATAREYSEQARLIAHEVGARRTEAYALTHLGHALAGLGLLDEAADAYRQALTLRKALGEQNLAMESLAGLARVSTALGDLANAETQIEQILSYLGQNSGDGLDGISEPIRVYLTCYSVLRARQDRRAGEILERAYHLLHERATRISDEKLRRSFLENVPAHREILQEHAGGGRSL